MVKGTVLYPNDGGKFDLDYYVNIHIPMAKKLLKPFGLIKVEVDKGVSSPAGDPPPYVVISHLTFETTEQMEKGMQAHDPELGADISNYTDSSPTLQISEVLVS